MLSDPDQTASQGAVWLWCSQFAFQTHFCTVNFRIITLVISSVLIFLDFQGKLPFLWLPRRGYELQPINCNPWSWNFPKPREHKNPSICINRTQTTLPPLVQRRWTVALILDKFNIKLSFGEVSRWFYGRKFRFTATIFNPVILILMHFYIIWAASSEFVSSSNRSWQILTVHAQPFRGARDLAFCLKVPLDSLLVWASSGGSGETARMRRLAWTFAARIGDKYQIRLTRPIFPFKMHYCLPNTKGFSNIKPDVSQWQATLHYYDISFLTVYHRIYCRKFLMSSNQTSGYNRKCIRIKALLHLSSTLI